jgi:pilus assembly protein CpaB
MAAVLPSGMRAISTRNFAGNRRPGGFILPGDRVDVILSRRDKQAEKLSGVEAHVSETILKNVRVLAVDQTVEEKERPERSWSARPRRSNWGRASPEILANGRQKGTLSLALRSIVDAVRQGRRSQGGTMPARGSTSFVSVSTGDGAEAASPRMIEI